MNNFNIQYLKPLTQHRRKPKRKPGGESRRLHRCAVNNPQQAFTLLEVMIAVAIFFMAVFAILALTSRSLQAARSLRQSTVDAGSLAAQLSLTNRLEEGMESGDFGDLYPDYAWTQNIAEVGTNGLFQVDFWVYQSGAGMAPEPTLSILLFRPESGLASRRGGAARR